MARRALLLHRVDLRPLLPAIRQPVLLVCGSHDPLVGKARNPMVDLPLTVGQVLGGIEMTIVSHLHRDHFDAVATASK